MAGHPSPIAAFVDELQTKFPVVNSWDKEFSINPGRKYTKIVHGGSVYAFVNNETLELIKAASWAKPALNAQGESAKKYFLDTFEQFDIAIYNADRSGGFLYMDYPVQLPH